MKLSYLIRGLPGHPSHPPLTDVVIGVYTFAVIAAILNKLGVEEEGFAYAWYLAMYVGAPFAIITYVTGIADWLRIRNAEGIGRTATIHGIANIVAGVFYVIALQMGDNGYDEGVVETGAFVMTLIGWSIMGIGGWLGGTIVFVHGMRVLELEREPTRRAVSPLPEPEKEMAEGRQNP